MTDTPTNTTWLKDLNTRQIQIKELTFTTIEDKWMVICHGATSTAAQIPCWSLGSPAIRFFKQGGELLGG